MIIDVKKYDFETSNNYGYFKIYGGKRKFEELKNKGYNARERSDNYTILLHYNKFNIMQDVRYTLEIAKANNGINEYTEIINIENLYCDIKNMTQEEQIDMMENIKIADTYIRDIKKCYPNFVKDVLNGKKEDILQNKNEIFKNANKRTITNLENTINKIIENILPVTIKKDFNHYNLTIKECYKIIDNFNSYEQIKDLFAVAHYMMLCKILNRSFFESDRLILSHDEKLKDDKQRYEYFIRSLIIKNEILKGDTYCFKNYVLSEIKQYIGANTIDINYDRAVDIIENVDNNNSEFMLLIDNNSSFGTCEILCTKNSFNQEYSIKSFISSITKSNYKLDINVNDYVNTGDIALTDEQKEVLQSVIDNKITICNAKAGTGKTSILQQITKMCLDNDVQCILLAPTGRVSKKVTDTCNNGLICNTIDRAWYRSLKSEKGLECDKNTVIVIEEGSMIGTELFIKIIDLLDYDEYQNIKILVNMDLEQLPPVNKGCVLRDLIYNIGLLENTKVCNLTKVFRYADGGIAEKADVIRSGRTPFKDLKIRKEYAIHGKDLAFKRALTGYNLSKQIIREFENAYCLLKKRGLSHMDIMKNITFITPYRKRENGSIAINNIIQKRLAYNTKETYIKVDNISVKLKVNDIVINTENNYKCITKKAYDLVKAKKIKMEDIKNDNYDDKDTKGYVYPVFNGSFGIIKDILKDGEVLCEFDGVEVVFDNEEKYNLNLGYAVTTHKLQGSDNKYIISVISNKHKDFVNKNHIYTDITRAKEFFVGLWDIDTIQTDVSKESIKDRNTLLDLFISYNASIDNMLNKKEL